MSLHDRIRRELHRTADSLDVSGAGPSQVAADANRRSQRARMVGGLAALLLVLGVGGVALALRSESSTDQETLSTASQESETAPANEAADPAPVDSEPAEAEGQATDDEAPPPSDPEQSENDPSAPPQTSDEDGGSAAPEDQDQAESPSTGGVTAGATKEMLAYRGGFVALRESGALEFSENGSSWVAVADPRPGGAGQIRDLDSHNGVLYATGTAGEANQSSWLSATENLSTWSPISLPGNVEDGSGLSSLANIVYSIDASSAGLIISGETLAFLDVSQLVSAEVLANDAWTIGDSSGDTSKLVVYDVDDGNPVEEIDLASAGVPSVVLEVLSSPDPIPFVATGSRASVESVETDLEPGSVLGNLSSGDAGYLGAAFNSQFRAHTAWESTNARNWSGIPVSVVRVPNAEAVGTASTNDVVFSGQGPLLTAQVRQGSDWNEIRLDRLIGIQNANYELIDASFGGSRVAVAVAVSGPTGGSAFYLLQSSNGVDWTATELSGALPGDPQLTAVESIATGRARVAVSYRHADGSHRTATVSANTG